MVTLMEFHGYLYPCLTHIKPKFLLCRNQESNQVHNQVHNQAIYQEMIFSTGTYRQTGTLFLPSVGRADPPPC